MRGHVGQKYTPTDKNYLIAGNRIDCYVIDHLAKVEQLIMDSKQLNTYIITDYYGLDFDKTMLELHRNRMLDIAKTK